MVADSLNNTKWRPLDNDQNDRIQIRLFPRLMANVVFFLPFVICNLLMVTKIKLNKLEV